MGEPVLLARRPSGQRFALNLPPGEYYVGDPCYVLPGQLFSWLSDQIFPAKPGGGYDVFDVHVSVPLPDGGKAELFDMRTKYGDGSYPLVPRKTDSPISLVKLPVDSGGMAVIDARLVEGRSPLGEVFKADSVVPLSAEGGIIVTSLFVVDTAEDGGSQEIYE